MLTEKPSRRLAHALKSDSRGKGEVLITTCRWDLGDTRGSIGLKSREMVVSDIAKNGC